MNVVMTKFGSGDCSDKLEYPLMLITLLNILWVFVGPLNFRRGLTDIIGNRPTTEVIGCR